GVLFEDYRNAGGRVASLDDLRRNAGGEALNAYLHARAAQPDAVGLLGAMYIIEGTGQRIVPALLPLLRQRLGWLGRSFTFLAYHGENDVAHLERWLQALTVAVGIGGRAAAAEILEDARCVAVLYARQLQLIVSGDIR
ncbi:MAG TPA: iron-containing redox enzyme family protein, partial [Luteimonas sp.]|nr:iron-containing redox enzyme family protein [Luteimonas sp.]